jgi:hypothetical protein
MRRRWRTRRLWIDSICIDQTSMEEKNHQVALMGDIYKMAEKVDIWLGAGDVDIDDTLKELSWPRWLSWFGYLLNRLRRIATGLFTNSGSLEQDHLGIYSHRPGVREEYDSVLAARKIVQNQWFDRLWTFQEFCLAKRPMAAYGTTIIPWDRLHQHLQGQSTIDHPLVFASSWYRIDWMRSAYLDMLEDAPTSPPNPISPSGPHIPIAGSLAPEDEKTLRLANFATSILHLTRQRQASNPLDKIYGLGQIFADLGIFMPAPDYNLSAAKVYEEATFSIIQASRSLRILNCSVSQQRQEDLPSWVPDFSQMPWPAGNDLYSASLRMLFGGVTFDRKDGELSLPGMLRGKVEWVGNRMAIAVNKFSTIEGYRLQREETVSTLLSWCAYLKDQVHPDLLANPVAGFCATLIRPEQAVTLPTEASVDMAMLTKMIAAMQAPDMRASLGQQGPEQSMLRHVSEGVARLGGNTEEADVLANDTLSRLEYRTQGMALFKTSEYWGLSTADARIGDTVVLFPGTSTPMLLREGKIENRKFRLVGPASMAMISQETWDSVYALENLETITLV